MQTTSPSPTPVKRAISPTYNATGIASAVAAVYTAAVLIWNAAHHNGVIDPQAIVAAISALAFLYARFKVTPLADPKDGNGNSLVPLVTIPVPPAPTAPVPPTVAPIPPPSEVHDV